MMGAAATVVSGLRVLGVVVVAAKGKPLRKRRLPRQAEEWRSIWAGEWACGALSFQVRVLDLSEEECLIG
jgi:hypothetical protein